MPFKLREAWNKAINLHTFFVESYKLPRKWGRDMGGYRHKNFLPYWSKVEKLTVHLKTDLDPMSSDPAKHPVSQIDCALSEGVIRRLSLAYDSVPTDEAELTAFEEAHSTESERTAAHASVDAHRDFIIRLCLGLDGVAPITGPVERAVRDGRTPGHARSCHRAAVRCRVGVEPGDRLRPRVARAGPGPGLSIPPGGITVGP